MTKNLLSFATLAALAGCSSLLHQPLPAESAQQLQKQSIVQTLHAEKDKTPFAARTLGTAIVGGGIGGLMAASDGSKLVETHHIVDPAPRISTTLANALVSAHGMTLVTPPIQVVNGSATVLSDQVPGDVHYVLDVITSSWGVEPISLAGARYKVRYWALSRLIDKRTQERVATGTCHQESAEDSSAPTYDELLANDAARLKHELDVAATTCVATLEKDMLGL